MYNEKHTAFLMLAQKIEKAETDLGEMKDQLAAMMAELGLGTYIQDLNTSTVYKIVKPKGKYVFFADIDYTRTALAGERSGSLSKKEAEEAGFQLKK